ncbi:polysaccharide deacetylase family protein [Fluviicola sp.]|jgi:peptidoglycan/xylan/chitin deacetylase (PgdA/CDA1 family)|uniref:polysaccharide deacetylase family protein n=1 Tax=Fluviicola sp. TaxID=1917219 RepID=UPI0028359BB2|nr:polysaccharide deacetylase family protein [Fluviicola sp.]MDR0801469.1 polysaccharide deacetylase family protein [Fluviicola sp.]
MKHKLNIAIGCLSLLICFIFFRESPYFRTILISIAILFCVILSFGILFLRFEYFYPTVYKSTQDEVFLTFDDGPDPVHTPKILDILQKYEIKALFFVIGQKALENPELIQRIISEGHEIGNHTQNHPIFFAMYSRKKVAEEIDTAENTLKILTQRNLSLFRPPIGYMNPGIASILRKRNLKIVGWNVRSYDSFKNEEQLLKRLIRLTKKGNIVLMHDNLEHTSAVLETYIQHAQSNGIIFAKQEQLKKIIHEIHH